METTAPPLISLLLYLTGFFSGLTPPVPVTEPQSPHPEIHQGMKLPIVTFQLVKEDSKCKNRKPETQCLETNILLSETEIMEAHVSLNEYGGSTIQLTLSRRGAVKFAEITGKNRGRKLAITFKKRVLSAPIIQERIAGGRLQISGNFTLQEAQHIARYINAAAKYARYGKAK